MKRTDKKGFTIVELVIVIAVIAILAAVLIPNISKLVRKANESSDLSLVRNLNTALTVENKDYATAHEAFEAVKDAGYDLTKIEAKADTNKILYDSVNKCFVYQKGDNLEYYPNTYKTKLTPNDYYKLWSIETVAKENGEYTYSVYWNGEDNAEVTVKGVGFDAGSKTTKSVTYTGASEARSVVIRTNGGTLTINAANDEVDRHGKCDLLDVQAVKATSLHEYGTSNMVSIKSGRIIFETVDSAKTVAFVEGNGAILAVVNNVEMPTVKRASDVTSFIMQTVSPAGDVATKSTVSISNGAVTVTTENGATTPANIKAEAIKESVKAEATKEVVKNENIPVTIATLDDLKNYLESDAVNGVIAEDIESTETLHVKKNKIIDLNGHVLTAKCVTSRLFWLENGCSIFTVNGTKPGSAMVIGDNHTESKEKKVWGFIDIRAEATGCNVTINGGSYSGSTCANDDYTYGGFFAVRATGAILTLNNLTAETDVIFVNTNYGNTNVTVNVNGGNYKVTGINAYLTGSFTVTNAKAVFNDIVLTAQYGGCIQSGKETTLNNCTVTVTSDRTGEGTHQNCAASIEGGGTLTINGGTFSAPYALYVYSSGGTITVNGGTFVGSKNVLRADGTGVANRPSSIVVKDGQFTGTINATNDATITIEGGTFSVDPTSYVNTEIYSVTPSNSIWTVKKK